MIDEHFVSAKVRHLFLQFATLHGGISPPVDPWKLANHCGVLNVEYRRMVPEGVLTPVHGGFTIYLQSNFSAPNRGNVRERFSLAHELAHTFFYDQNQTVPKPIKGAPRGQRLEHLCHVAASEILLPPHLLNDEIRLKGKVTSAEALTDLAMLFDVSLEALIRRLHQSRLIDEEKFAAILVDSVEGKEIIRAACYGPVLICNTTQPHRGLDFGSWASPLFPPSASPQDGEWTHTTKTAVISAKRITRSARSFILELQFEPPPIHRQTDNTGNPR
jgi:hypothetical protein